MVIKQNRNETTQTISVKGRLDASTAPELERVVQSELDGVTSLVLDLEQLEYLSSAGLRVILMAQKIMEKQGEMIVRNVNAMMMEIFEVTGFVDILHIEKTGPYKEIILDESRMIGCGATGAVYQYQDDSIVKLYFSSSALEEIEREKKYAREAFILGLPTAISLGIVKVGEKYGLEYEFIKSKSMSGEIMSNPDETEVLVSKLVDVANALHTTSHKSGSRTSIFDSTKEFFLQHIAINPLLTEEEKELCVQFIESIPDRDTLIHGDFHPGNIMLSRKEAMLIDIADISYGHPIFDLAGLYFTLQEIPVFSKYRNEKGETRIGLTVEKSHEVWRYFIEKYFPHMEVAEKEEILKQIQTLSALRTVCLLTMHNREFSENDRIYFQESITERLIPMIPEVMGKINW